MNEELKELKELIELQKTTNRLLLEMAVDAHMHTYLGSTYKEVRENIKAQVGMIDNRVEYVND